MASRSENFFPKVKLILALMDWAWEAQEGQREPLMARLTIGPSIAPSSSLSDPTSEFDWFSTSPNEQTITQSTERHEAFFVSYISIQLSDISRDNRRPPGGPIVGARLLADRLKSLGAAQSTATRSGRTICRSSSRRQFYFGFAGC